MKDKVEFTKCDKCGNTSIDHYEKSKKVEPVEYLTMTERAKKIGHSMDGRAYFETIHAFMLRCRNCGFEVEYHLQY